MLYGADVSWLSQYPHERECLFAPLLGIEVVSTEVDANVLVVQTALSTNMSSLTLEQARPDPPPCAIGVIDGLVVVA